MKFIDEFDIELVNQNLSFDTVDSHIDGTIDLFTTKPLSSDRKLYKTIDKNWEVYSQEHQMAAAQQQQAQQQHQQQQTQNEPAPPSPPNYRVDMTAKQRSYSTSTIRNRPMFINNSNPTNFKSDDSVMMSKSLHTGAYISPSSLTDAETCVFGPLHQQTSRRTFAYLIGILNTCYPDHDFTSLNPDYFTLISSSSTLVSNINNLLISLGKSEQDLNWIWDVINSHMDLSECICFELDNDFLKQEILNSPSVLWCNFYFLYNRKRKRVAFLQLKSIFIQARRGSLIATHNNNTSFSSSRDVLDNSSENEYDLTNDVDQDDVIMDEDEDEVVGDLEF